jgi:histidine triad (HIT) family protein
MKSDVSILIAALGLCFLRASAAEPAPAEALYRGPDPFRQIAREQWLAESPHAFAVRDKNPQAPVHVLVISKNPVPTMLQASDDLLGEMLGLAKRVAEKEGIARDGFRVVINTHPKGGQSVYHLHMHVLGGRQMRWPSG